jgi:hypothetical protein
MWAATWGFLTALSRFTAVLNGAQVCCRGFSEWS